MVEPVKRGYRSELRATQAQDTRRRIVTAAAELFVATGFGATTVDAIAAAAGVSRKTVFTAAGGKVELLSLALDWAIAGDDAPIAVVDRPEVQALLQLRDPAALLDGWARVLVGIDGRVAELFVAMEAAANLDPAARAVFDTSNDQRREGAAMIVAAVASLGGLRRGLRRAEAVDIAWLLSDPVLYRRLVGGRGWTVARFEKWLAATLAAPTARRGGCLIGSLRWWESRRGSTARHRRTFRCPKSTWAGGDSGRVTTIIRDGAFATLRRDAPIRFFEALTVEGYEPIAGHWALTRFDDVHFASRHPEHLQFQPEHHHRRQQPRTAEYFGSMIVLDDPRHISDCGRSSVVPSRRRWWRGSNPRCASAPAGWSTEMIERQPRRRRRGGRRTRRPASPSGHLRHDGHPERRPRPDLPLDQHHPRLR